MGECQCSWSASDVDIISIDDKMVMNDILSASCGVNSTSGSLLLLSP
jgi:hypothetical protein